MPAWFEDDDFWRELYPYMFPPERLAAAADEVAQILALITPSGRDVLDLCCGSGRHSTAFARQGFTVTGVDRSPFMLNLARQHEESAGIEWVHADMFRFVRPGAFDLACSLFTSFGYSENQADDLGVLLNVHESLKPGGIFVMEMIGKERLARVLESAQCSEFPDGTLLFRRHQVRDDWYRCRVQWTLVKEGRARTFQFEHTIYSGRELKDRLLDTGFVEVRLFGDLAGAPYDVDAKRLVAVARKAP